MEPRETTLRILEDLTGRSIDPETNSGTPLRELGVSSLRMIQLIGDLESGLGIRIRDDEIDEDRFGDLGGLLRFVTEKTSE